MNNNYKKKYKDLFNLDSGVIELKYNNFLIEKNNVIFDNNNSLILVYAPWCKHCQIFAEVWSQLAIHYRNKFNLYSINSEDIDNKNDYIISKLKPNNYPILYKVDKNGKLIIFENELNLNDITYYISLKISN